MSADGLRTSDYDYHLPPERIAQAPVSPRDASRLLVLDRASGELAHRTFRDLAALIPAGDLLVVNDTRVFRARLLGKRAAGGDAEILLLRPLESGTATEPHWEAMIHPGGKLKPGRSVTIADGFAVDIVDSTPRRTRVVALRTDPALFPDAHTAIAACGHVPLPPYIERSDEPADEARYQTVYANVEGSVAAPTAGLHFTPELLQTLEARGVQRAAVTLHVGAGTFRPVGDDDPAAHVMHHEWCVVSDATAQQIAETRARGNHVWAVGTTVVRTLESAAAEDGVVRAGARETDLFIRPPYEFRAIDRLLTNFHLPKSTLIMLVAAFAGYGRTMHAYETAVREEYRFYSYGDAMCVL